MNKILNSVTYEKGTVLHKPGDEVLNLDIIVSGKVEVSIDGFSFTMKKSCIIGLFEMPFTPYSYEYTVIEDVNIISYPYNSADDLHKLSENEFNIGENLVTANAGLALTLSSKFRYLQKYSEKFISSVKESYEEYKKLCAMYKLDVISLPFLDMLQDSSEAAEFPDWILDYYDQLEIMPTGIKEAFFATHPSLVTATLTNTANHIKSFINMCSNIYHTTEINIDNYFSGENGNIPELLKKLLLSGEKSGADSSLKDEILSLADTYVSILGKNPLIPKNRLNLIYSTLNMSEAASEVPVDNDRYECIKHSLDTILCYSNLDEAEEERFKELVRRYKALKDKNSGADEDRILRQDLTKSFFDIYEAIALSSLEEASIPTIIKMFLYFGYIDENILGKENAFALYNLTDTLEINEKKNVYTVFDWLKSIYHGINEPSKNEFDQDYATFIKSQRQSGILTDEMAGRFLSSNTEKVRFEIQNLVKIASKSTQLRPANFCPVLSSHNLLRSLQDLLLKDTAISDNWKKIKSIDYGCFYRECIIKDESQNIVRQSVMKETMPIVILMPVIGGRGGLWQETAGITRDTPARMYMPILFTDDLYNLQINLAGEFRWNICKKIQGARWNDVTDHSLTGDYFDYLQFYKKNNELSADTKEKIRNQLINCKNNYRNVFIYDYAIWIKYESSGIPRLSKIAKRIMFEYCAPSKEYRNNLKNNPMFKELISRHEIQAAKKLKVLSGQYSKIEADLSKLPAPLLENLKYYML